MAAPIDEFGSLDVRRPFTRADAVRAGVPPSILRTSRFRRIFRGVHVLREVPDSPFLRAEAALVLHPPTAFVSHTTAARILGLPVPHDPLEHVTVLTAADRRSRPEIRNHVTTNGTPAVRGYRGRGCHIPTGCSSSSRRCSPSSTWSWSVTRCSSCSTSRRRSS